MSDIIKLVGEEVDEITLVGRDIPYKGKKEGSFYNRYRYNGVIFTADNNSDFAVEFDKNTISSVKLLKGVRTIELTSEDGEVTSKEVDNLQFESFISFGKEINRVTHSLRMDTLKRVATSGELTPEMVSSLLAVAV